MWLIGLFIAVPIIEIALFIQVGGLIGLWPTLGLVLLSAVIGTALMRSQGGRAWIEVQRSFSELRDPSRPLAHGAMILVAGMLLLTPGFFTDSCGILLLIPPVREAVIRYLSSRIQVTQFGMPTGGVRREAHRAPYGDGIIDGDYVVQDEADLHAARTPPDLPPDLPEDGTVRRGNSGWTRH